MQLEPNISSLTPINSDILTLMWKCTVMSFMAESLPSWATSMQLYIVPHSTGSVLNQCVNAKKPTSLWTIFSDELVSHELLSQTMPLSLLKGSLREKLQCVQAAILPVEAYTPNANLCEAGIRELKQLF
jgi:hypothetical protein